MEKHKHHQAIHAFAEDGPYRDVRRVPSEGKEIEVEE